MNQIKKLSFQTLWQLINKAISSLTTFFILGLIARHYSSSSIGVYTLALTYLAMFYLLSDFGFNAHVLPFLKQENAQEIWRKLFGLRILWSLLLTVLAVAILPLLPFSKGAFPYAVVLGSLAILGNSLFITATSVFQSKLSLGLSSMASSLGIIFMTILMYIFVSSGLPVIFLLLAQTLGWFFTGTFSLVFLGRFYKTITPLFDFEFMKGFFIETWPISLTLALNLVYFRFDSFVLSSIKSFQDVGVYNIAYSVFQSALVMPAFIMNGLYPLMVDELHANRSNFFKYFKKALIYLLGLSVLGTITTLILAPFIMSLILGRLNTPGAPESLRILSLGFPVYFLTALFMWTFVTLKKYKSMAFIYTGGLLLNMALNLYYIPKYSYIASSWITVISELLILILQIIILVPTLRKLK